jgi:2,3-diketo-5-methylthio-1-phosphopentane phosphatase
MIKIERNKTEMNPKFEKIFNNVPKGDIAILCDFDGTITNEDTLGFIFREFAACGMDNVIRYARGEIDMREEIRTTFNTIDASKEELEFSLKNIRIEGGFLNFLDFAKSKNYGLAIVSDGLDWYIDHILKRYDVQDIPIFANEISFEPDGFRFYFPWFNEESPRRGVCKSLIARVYSNHYEKVVFIGDGRSDVNIVLEADVVFARGWLASYCSEKNINHIEFRNWDELMNKWRVQL